MSHRHHAQAPHYPGPAYPPSNYHPSSRHLSSGPPPPGMMGAPPPMSMSMNGPPEPMIHPTNGHSHNHHPRGPPSGGGSAATRIGAENMEKTLASLANANENTWMLIGAVAEQVQDQPKALRAFETALKHNPNSVLALNAVASIHRNRDDFDKAIEYFQRILNIKQDNGEVWGSMGHCLLMKDDLPKAYTAYQQALYHLPNPKQEPKLWYGIGILYDRYGSFEHAEEAFSSVLKMDQNFEKANEIYFRLGIIYKHQHKYGASLDCFRYILNNPPRPLTSWDIYFQLGHVYEQDGKYEEARDAYSRVLEHQPDHSKVLQQLGWLHHQPGAPFADNEKAVQYLTRSLEADGNDAQSWYLLGRAYMAAQRYNKAYEAYQQAVYRDGRNPTFWCSIGVLYYQINQYRDALDAYSRAIRLNAYISEVWFNLGSLYESCNNQVSDAIDAYGRAAQLDQNNTTIRQRLQMLQQAQNGQQLTAPPQPVDVHPSQYSAAPSGGYADGSPHGSPGRGPLDGRMDGPPPSGRDLPPPPPGGDMARGHSPGPFRGGGAAPPPLQLADESRGSMSHHAPLAPIEMGAVDTRDGPSHNGPPRDPLDRRHVDSPSSPRQRAGHPSQYPQHPGYDRHRERDDWERKERERARAPAGPDPRGPSPRIPEYRQGGQMASHRVPSDPRDYPRYGEGSNPQFDRPYYNDPRYEPRREERLDGPRGPSVVREDAGAHSPAPSAASRASTKRKQKEDESRNIAKKVREESSKPSSKKSGNVKGNGEKKSHDATSMSENGAPSAAPNRAIDEDYDDGAGAVDALMTLHGDRPSGGESESSSPAPASGAASNKRAATSPKVEAVQAVKRAKNGSDSPATRTVIEVLNTPNVDSPVPKPEAGSNGEGYFKGVQAPKPDPDTVASESATMQESAPEPIAPAVETAPQGESVKATEDRPPTPPMQPAAAPAASTEDVPMAEPERSVPQVEAEATPTLAPSAIEPTGMTGKAIEPSADKPATAPQAVDAMEKEMEVDAPAEAARPATPDLPTAPSNAEPTGAAAETAIAQEEPGVIDKPAEGEKKDE